MFSRLGGEIYIAGINDAGMPLPELATEAKIRDEDVQRLRKEGQKLLGKEVDGKVEDLEVVRTGLCFRPVTDRGTPILGRIAGERLGGGGRSVGVGGRKITGGDDDYGVWIAAGHGPWGISLSLGTGLVIAEMMQGKKTSADVRGLAL